MNGLLEAQSHHFSAWVSRANKFLFGRRRAPALDRRRTPSLKMGFFKLILLLILTIGAYAAPRDNLLMLMSGEWVSRGLYVASKLDIAEHLKKGPKDVKELGELTQTSPEALQRMLRMLTGFHLFEEVAPGRFANTETSLLLASSNADGLHDLALFFGEEMHQAWGELLQTVKTGAPAFPQPVFSYFKEHPDRAALFQRAMREKSKAVISGALQAYDFGRFQNLYDLGGGMGHFLQAIVARNPKMQGTLFELPEVVKSLPKLGERCRALEGDFFASVPKGGDAYLLKSVLHDWDEAKSLEILKKCHEAMDEKSRLLIVEAVLLPKEESLYANCMDVHMMVVTGGRERTLADFQRLLERAGFTLRGVYPTGTEFSILEASKAL